MNRFKKSKAEPICKEKKMVMTKAFLMGLLLCLFCATPVFATEVVTQKLGSIESLVSGIITAAGGIVLLWGIFEFAAAYQSHDTSQQIQSLKKIVSGLVMAAAPTIVNMLK